MDGRFLEIGKRDLFKNHQLDMRHFVKCLSFLVLDVGPDSPGFDEAWRAVEARFESGDFRPLPFTAFPLSRMSEGIEFMAQAQHVGKVVLEVVGSEKLEVVSGQLPVAEPVEAGVTWDVLLGDVSNNQRSTVNGQLLMEEPTHRISDTDSLPTTHYPPATKTEKAIAEVWENLLGVEQIGIHDDFFDLRGDSLLAAQVISHIHRAVGVRLPLSAVFDAPTVAGLAALVEQAHLADVEAEIVMEEGEI